MVNSKLEVWGILLLAAWFLLLMLVRNKNILGYIGCRSDLASHFNNREERTSNSDSRFKVKLSVFSQILFSVF